MKRVEDKMNELLKMEHIHFKYEKKFTALNDISLTFYEGERIAVLGNNGAGKSTLFLCANGVLTPQRGKIFLKGQEVGKSKKDITRLRQAVGLVFQDADSQIIAGSVENEVSFGPMNLSLSEDDVRVRVSEALSQMNLTGYEDRAPQYLSGGEKKRVSIADILAMHPELILFDEPTASLDPANVEVLEQTLDMLSQKDITLVVSTHDVDFAYRFADRIIVFSEADIVFNGDRDEAFSDDEMLERAGLKKPLLFETAQLLESRFPEIRGQRPRHIKEFREYIDRIK